MRQGAQVTPPDCRLQVARRAPDGLKLGSTNIKDVKLIAPPQSGKVDIQGPSFSYTAKADFQGQDEFTVQVSGTVVRIAGVSDVKGDGVCCRQIATNVW